MFLFCIKLRWTIYEYNSAAQIFDGGINESEILKQLSLLKMFIFNKTLTG